MTPDEGNERQMTEDTATATVDDSTEVEDDDGVMPSVVMLGMALSGGVKEFLGGMSNDLRAALTKALDDAKTRRVAEEITEWVTPQIADEVLHCYGDLDGTTEPSLAVAALINLIRTAYISDEHIMAHLNETEHFHGYVIAIVFLADRGPEGLRMLRKIAKLSVPDKPETTDA